MVKIKRLIKKLFISVIIFSLIITPISSFAYTDYSYIWSSPETLLETSAETTTVSNENSLNLTCGSAILIEQSSGKVLYDHNSHEKLRPASVTKIMTILLIMEAIDSED